jgi:glucan 1,3-beta-glucosidase
MIKGVNLGNWLVLEKWMSPALFDGTDAEDEFHLCLQLDDAIKRERFKVHRDSYITERDFAYIAGRGLDSVRIPVPYFVFDDHGPFVSCIEYLDRAFDWAEAHDLKILLDLHTVPGSQNGFDNGGICGVCVWHTHPEDVELALEVLERLAERYRGRTTLWGIQVLNEPISPELWEAMDIPSRYPSVDPELADASEPVPTEFLKDFYAEAYRRIRRQSDEVAVVFHDGFRPGDWGDFFTSSGFERIVLDTHQYLMVQLALTGRDELEEYLRCIREEWAPLVRELAAQVPLIVGEWCVDTTSPKPLQLGRAERADYFRQLGDAQLAAWAPADGWFYWSYKLLVSGPDRDGWDLGKGIDVGYLPADFSAVG